MAPATALQNRYLADAVATVPPARLVTMLYDALVSDMTLAEQAIAGRDLARASDRLVHAQELVLELHASLDTTKWPAGEQLKALYVFLVDELVAANVAKDAGRVATCRGLVEPLRDAWHEAARRSGGS